MKSLPGFAALFSLLLLLAHPAFSRADDTAAQMKPIADIAYKTGDKLGDKLGEYEAQRCKLDLYLPPGADRGSV